MSTALLGTLVAALLVVSLVQAWPHNVLETQSNHRQRRDGPGSSRNTQRIQPFGAPYYSDQQESSQSRGDDFAVPFGYLEQFANNRANTPAVPVNVDVQHGARQGVGSQPSLNLQSRNSEQTHSHSSDSHQGLNSATKNSEQVLPGNTGLHHITSSGTRNNKQVLPITTNSHHVANLAARNNKQVPPTSTGSRHVSSSITRSTEAQAVTRGNRRVVTANNAALRSQALTDTNEEMEKAEENKFHQSSPTINNSDSNHKLRETRIQNNSGVSASRNRNQSLWSSVGNDSLKEEFPVINNSQGVSSNRKDLPQQQFSMQGRIVTPTVTHQEKHPEVFTDQKQWDDTIQAQRNTVPNSSGIPFKGDANTTSTRSSGGEIVFPDTKFKPRIGGDKKPACAQGSTFCTDAENYPLPHLSSILKNEIGYQEYFGVDKFEVLAHRIGEDDDDQLCTSQEKVIFPKIAQNKDEEWMFVVNLDKEYVQGVRIELCEKDNSPCQLSDGLPSGYMTTCRQKYIYRKLLAVGNDGKPAPDSFRLPSCCACYYHKTSVTNRFNNKMDSSPSKPQG